MTMIGSTPSSAAPQHHGSDWYTRASLLMLPVTVGTWYVMGIVGYLMLRPLGLHEGDVPLMQRGVAGWTAEIGLDLVAAAPAVIGAWFAISGLRRGGGWGARLGLALNTALAAMMIYTFVDAIHMTYFPGAQWLWFD